MWPFGKRNPVRLIETYRLQYNISIKHRNVGTIAGEAEVKAESQTEAMERLSRQLHNELEIKVTQGEFK
jgi:hypothetical protein